ncbi:MAG: hypothetical protein V2A74_07580, partial [bacterium]
MKTIHGFRAIFPLVVAAIIATSVAGCGTLNAIRTHQQVVENYRRDVIVFYESTGEAYEQLSGEYLRLAEQYTELNRPE